MVGVSVGVLVVVYVGVIVGVLVRVGVAVGRGRVLRSQRHDMNGNSPSACPSSS